MEKLTYTNRTVTQHNSTTNNLLKVMLNIDVGLN